MVSSWMIDQGIDWTFIRHSIRTGFYLIPITLLISVGSVFNACSAAEKKEGSRRFDSVLEESRLSGRPVLAVAGYKNCAPCRALRTQLAGDEQLKSLADHFLRIDLTIDGDGRAEWRQWQDLTETDSSRSPQVFILRADGKVLFGDSPSRDVETTLSGALKVSGQVLTSDQAKQAFASVTQAKSMAELGDKALAVSKIAPLIKTETFASPIIEAKELQDSWIAELKNDLPKPNDTIADTEDGLKSAMVLVSVSKSLGKISTVLAKDANRQLAVRRKNEDETKVIAIAEQLYQAATTMAQSNQRGIALYQKVIDSAPTTSEDSKAYQAAAKIAKSRITKPKLSK